MYVVHLGLMRFLPLGSVSRCPNSATDQSITCSDGTSAQQKVDSFLNIRGMVCNSCQVKNLATMDLCLVHQVLCH